MSIRFLRCARVCSILFLGSFRTFAQDAATTPQPTSIGAAYPESTDGLKSLLQDMLAAIRSRNKQRTSQLLATFSVPNHKEWFLKSFGAIEGARMEDAYTTLESKAPDRLRERFEGVAKRGQIEVAVRVVQKPIDPNAKLYKAVSDAMTTDFPIYDATGGTDFLGDFVYLGGGFRYLDKQVCLALSNAPVMRVLIGGNVQAARLISIVQPVYPEEAKHDHVEGTVAMHVIIGKDGTVLQASVISGPPILTQPTVDAVKQWRYKPTLLNGMPVEVDTKVDIIYHFHP